jgi:CHAT domain-containing protein
VVAGLWNVADRTTAVLMKNFYDELDTGKSPVAALREAKLEMMELGGANGKPYYWAAFQAFTKALYQ